jgi:hypothetical protein
MTKIVVPFVTDSPSDTGASTTSPLREVRTASVPRTGASVNGLDTVSGMCRKTETIAAAKNRRIIT